MFFVMTTLYSVWPSETTQQGICGIQTGRTETASQQAHQALLFVSWFFSTGSQLLSQSQVDSWTCPEEVGAIHLQCDCVKSLCSEMSHWSTTATTKTFTAVSFFQIIFQELSDHWWLFVSGRSRHHSHSTYSWTNKDWWTSLPSTWSLSTWLVYAYLLTDGTTSLNGGPNVVNSKEIVNYCTCLYLVMLIRIIPKLFQLIMGRSCFVISTSSCILPHSFCIFNC